MTSVDPPMPFSTAWVSESLYRPSSDPDPFLGELAGLVDRHVDSAGLDVPLFSSVISGP